MKLKANINFTYGTAQEAQAVATAVAPDNLETPSGLSVKTTNVNCHLIASITCDKSLETFIATLDDLLACISVAEKTYTAVK